MQNEITFMKNCIFKSPTYRIRKKFEVFFAELRMEREKIRAQIREQERDRRRHDEEVGEKYDIRRSKVRSHNCRCHQMTEDEAGGILECTPAEEKFGAPSELLNASVTYGVEICLFGFSQLFCISE